MSAKLCSREKQEQKKHTNTHIFAKNGKAESQTNFTCHPIVLSYRIFLLSAVATDCIVFVGVFFLCAHDKL